MRTPNRWCEMWKKILMDIRGESAAIFHITKVNEIWWMKHRVEENGDDNINLNETKLLMHCISCIDVFETTIYWKWGCDISMRPEKKIENRTSKLIK